MKNVFIATLMLAVLTHKASADCLLGCDSINRDRSADVAKLREALKASNLAEEDDEMALYCLQDRKKYELTVVTVQAIDSRRDELLVVTAQRYAPPDLGASELNKAQLPKLFPIKVMRSLRFGVSGMMKKKSNDERCRASIITEGNLSDGLVVVCDYADNADLPVSHDRIDKVANTRIDYEACIE